MNRLRKRHGKENEATAPIEDNDILNVRLEELGEDGLVKEEGATNESLIAVDLIKDEDIKYQILQLELDGQLNINLKKAFDRDEEELLKFLLGKSDEEAEGLGMDYQLTVLNIKRVELSDMTPEFYKQVYQDDSLDTEEKFMERFRQDFEELSEARSNQRFIIDIYNHLLETIQISLPEDFIKKYVRQTSEGEAKDEKLDEQFGDILKSVKWELIREKIANENEIKVEQADLEYFALEDVKRMYRQYGYYMPDEEAKPTVQGMLKDQKYVQETYGKILEGRIFDLLTTQVKSEPQSISFEDFTKLN